jgi:hypothetical protein
MLADLLFGTYRKKVLSLLLLHPDADYHVRGLARQTDTAPGTLHKELARLAAAGLLLRKAQGNQVRYQANQQCPAFPELAGLLCSRVSTPCIGARPVCDQNPCQCQTFSNRHRP